MIFARLKGILEGNQSPDQTGFRTGIRLEDALATAEIVISKTGEWNLPLFIASLDLKKAIDRIEHEALFASLRSQGVDEPHLALLMDIYFGQVGSANGSRDFNIERGVRQGDVLSSLLFNAALETVFRNWKRRLTDQGWLISPEHERLTNTRYADDILIYGKSLNELKVMMELLHDELLAVGLRMHEGKTKILTSRDSCAQSSVNVRGMPIEILSTHASHRYLGRVLSLDASTRAETEVNNRIKLAWWKFNRHRRWLTNRHIPIALRLRLFELAVQPTAVFGLHVLPLKAQCLERIGSTQRKMKRCMVGWVRRSTDEWADTMRRMRMKVDRADALYRTRSWQDIISHQRWKFVAHLKESACDWPRLLTAWHPQGRRSQARPRLRWDDHTNTSIRQATQYNNWVEAPQAELLRLAEISRNL